MNSYWVFQQHMIPRFYNDLEKYLEKGRVLVIFGPRRVGKTTLLKNYLSKSNKKIKFDSGDSIKTQQILSSQDFSVLAEYVSGYELVVIDEAQQIPNIGMGLKIIVDQNPEIMVIATGSSSFDLANKIGEPLTGDRKSVV